MTKLRINCIISVCIWDLNLIHFPYQHDKKVPGKSVESCVLIWLSLPNQVDFNNVSPPILLLMSL